MNGSNSIAVIGEKDIVLPFKAIGYSCCYETEKDEIIARCKELAEMGCRIILILEKEAEKVGDYLNAMAAVSYPIIIPIPDGITNSGYGLTRLNKNIEKAMGSKTGGNL